MSLIDLPTSTDFAPWMNHSVPSDSRNYHRLREEPIHMSTSPTDLNSADEGVSILEYSSDLETPAEKEQRLKEEELKEKDIDKEPKENIKPSNLILAFQSFFKKTHPILGRLYAGPKDGKMNISLSSAARAAELKIGKAIGSNVEGMIYSNNKFVTSPADVSSAIELITKQEKKSSKLSRKERILALSSFIPK